MIHRSMCLLFTFFFVLVLADCGPTIQPSEKQLEQLQDGNSAKDTSSPDSTEQIRGEQVEDASSKDEGSPQEKIVETKEVEKSTQVEDWKKTIAHTSYGPVEGNVRDNVYEFLGIPFAKAPAGALRWQPPHKPAMWTEIKKAQTFSKSCLQVEANSSGEVDGKLDFADMSEDCLRLNVWAPSAAGPGQKLPVMVWIHGGGYNSGSAKVRSYHGKALASTGRVIVVTIQYRLGMLGFLKLASLKKESLQLDMAALAVPGLDALIKSKGGLTGNYGFLDQIAALHWVKQNIRVFGGDSSKVTLFGESAGGGSVAHMLETPLAKDLFHKAIIQSGLNRYLSENTQEKISRELLQFEYASHITKTAPTTSEALSNELAYINTTLRKVEASELIKKSWNVWTKDGGKILGPYVDGAVLPGKLSALVKSGALQDKPLLAGTNLNELSFFQTPQKFLRTLPTTFNPTKFFDAVLASGVKQGTYTSVVDAKKVYSVDHCSSESDRRSQGLCVYNELERIHRDTFKGFAHIFAKAMTTSYVYQFTRIAPGSVSLLATLKASHGFEIPYAFANLEYSDEKGTFYDAEDKTLEGHMSGIWLDFATSDLKKAPSVQSHTMTVYSQGDTPFTEFGKQLSNKELVSSLKDYCDSGCEFGAKTVLESTFYNP